MPTFGNTAALKEDDVVSFKHHGFLPISKKPKLPLLYRLRSDLTWPDVIAQWKEPKPPKGKYVTFPYIDY